MKYGIALILVFLVANQNFAIGQNRFVDSNNKSIFLISQADEINKSSTHKDENDGGKAKFSYPGKVHEYKALAELNAQKKDFSKAVSYYNDAIALDPNNYDLRVGRGFALVHLSKFNKAIEDFDFALKDKNTLFYDHVRKAKAECEKFIKNNWKFKSDKFLIDGKPIE